MKDFKELSREQFNAMLRLLNIGCEEDMHGFYSHLFKKSSHKSTSIEWHPLLTNAVKEMYDRYVFKESKEHKSYDEFIASMRSFQSTLHKLYHFASDKYVKDYLIRTTYEDVPIEKAQTMEFIESTYLPVFLGVKRISDQVDKFLDVPKKGKGRPSYKAFYDYVFYLAWLYEKYSGSKFTVLRHKQQNEGGETSFDPVTDGHKFVYHGVELMKVEALWGGIPLDYTDSNIYNACEKARTRLKNLNNEKMNFSF